MTSPAVRSFFREWFEEWGIPLFQHEARIVGRDEDRYESVWNVFRSNFRPWIDRYVSVFVDPPGITRSVLYGPSSIRVPDAFAVDKRYFIHEEQDDIVVESTDVVLRFSWGDAVRRVRALPGSLWSELHDLSTLLVELYGWREEEAGWFVLTGETPYIDPIAVSASLLTGYRHSPPVWTVTMEVAPWVNAKTVTRIYREVQKQILQGDNSGTKLRNVAVLRFVTGQTATHGGRPSWRVLLERWNRRYPEGHEWHYTKTADPNQRVRNFKRDYDRAKKVVMDPDHKFPKRRATTEFEHREQQDLEVRRRAAEMHIDEIIATLEITESPSD